MESKYSPVWRTSDEEASTHIELDAILLEEKLKSVRKAKLLVHILALLAAIALVVNVYFLLQAKTRDGLNLQDGLYSDLVPSMPVETLNFEEQLIYSAPPSTESNQAWDDLLPPGRGYVFARNSAEYGLKPGESTPVGEIYSVAVFHQLHCLGMLRNNYWTLLNKAINQEADIESFALMHKHNKHANHCFDYLRQALQCGGDMALEWPRTEKNGMRKIVDGWGIPHQCKRWDAIMEYMAENHFNASKRTDISGE